ncbi:MAG: porin family protein [Psychroflexus sp.]
MKKITLLLALLLGIISYSQEVKFGAKGGLNIADMKNEISEGSISAKIDSKARFTFYAGGFVEFHLSNPKLRLQAELLYMNTGTRFEGDEFTGDVDYNFSQLNIPLIAKYQIFDNFFLHGGGYLGFVLDAEVESDSETMDVTDEVNSLDLGLLFGAEYHLENGIFFELRYNLGLANLIDTDTEGYEESIKNRFLNIGLGYKF